MKVTTILILILVAFGLATCFVGCGVYSGYNKSVRLDESVTAAWSQVDNQLQRRYELVPNLVETVKGFATQEQEVFLGVAEARKAYFSASSPAEKIKASNGFESALSRLLVLRETYPELKSNQSFLKLQDTLEGTENRISVERKRYNDAVRQLNTFVRGPWGRFVSGLAGVEKREYFEAAEEATSTPQVDFGDLKGSKETG
jgi:LemA protein